MAIIVNFVVIIIMLCLGRVAVDGSFGKPFVAVPTAVETVQRTGTAYSDTMAGLFQLVQCYSSWYNGFLTMMHPSSTYSAVVVAWNSIDVNVIDGLHGLLHHQAVFRVPLSKQR